MKTKTTVKMLAAIVAVTLFLASCEKEAGEDLNKGFSEEIKNFVPDSTIQKMRELGMIIHEGKNPPNIEGYYMVAPNIMKNSSVPNEKRNPGDQFADYQHHFYDQKMDKLTISLNTKGLSDNGRIFDESTGNGAFLSGSENSFTAFLLQNGKINMYNNDTAFYQMLEVISGNITEDGIENFHKAILMLDDYGDSLNTLIPINSGRVFYDSDSLAQIVIEPKSGYLNDGGFNYATPVVSDQ